MLLLPVAATAQDTLSLSDALRMGLESNFSIRIARNDAVVAKNNNSLGNAGFLPKVDATGSTTQSSMDIKQDLANGTSVESNGYKTQGLNAGVQLSWTLFDGFAMFANRERLSLLRDLGDLGAQMAVEDVSSSIIISYCTIVQEQKLQENYREVLDLSLVRLNVARQKAAIGSGYQLATMQAEVDYRADSSQLLSQQSRVANLKIELNKTLGRAPETQFEVERAIPTAQAIVLDDIYTKLDAQNKDLMVAKLNLRVKEVAVKEANAARYPRVALSSAYSFSRNETPAGTTEVYRSLGPSFGLGASVTLFNGMNANRNIKNARLQRESQELRSLQTTIDVRGEALKHYNDLTLANTLVEVEQQSVEMARTNVAVALEKYKIGMISDLELRDAQTRLLSTEYRYLNAQLKAKTAEVGLQVLMGAIVVKSEL